jgi:hypothetical protein
LLAAVKASQYMAVSLYWSALWLHGLLEHFSPSLNTS